MASGLTRIDAFAVVTIDRRARLIAPGGRLTHQEDGHDTHAR